MRIVFIHSGSSYHKSLGSHYEQLIQHSMQLLPIKKYLACSLPEKDKYRSIQALPRKHIIGVAIIDESFWFTPEHLRNPWAHGPYCYHILDAVRLDEPISHGGKPGIWPISPRCIKQIQSMSQVMQTIHSWIEQYDISQPASKLFYAVTIFQPFAEAIIRKIKNIENRRSSQGLFRIQRDSKQEANDSQQGCRICIERRMKAQMTESQNSNSRELKSLSFDYKRYGQPFQRKLAKHGHAALPKCVDMDFSYHATASLTKCVCPKPARGAIASHCCASKSVSNVHRNHNDNRKPSERAKGVKGAEVMKSSSRIQTRSMDEVSIEKIVEMGFSAKAASAAMKKYPRMEDAVDFLLKLQSVQETNGCGYSEQLGKQRRDRKDTCNRKRKRLRCGSDGDEEEEEDVCDESESQRKRKKKKRKV
mmetsp:Transcript_37715/g.60412  ORF Transcript_37715/g.60412 Transcript_37715/m.60412 type:complete len:419 (+) Transcript_37715:56-1312(+)